MQRFYSHAATVLPVNDVEKALAFYTTKLGFDNTFKWGDPIDYAVMKAGEISIHLTQRADGQSPSSEHVALMIFVREIDDLYQQLLSKGVDIINEIGDRPYYMRDFDIADPDGHIISFGQGIRD